MAPIETIHIENTLATEDDPHKAALEDNPERAQRPTSMTLLAIFSLSLGFMGPISCAFALVTGVLVQIGLSLGDTSTTTWVVGGWSIASSVSFSIAGALSDIYGRRWVIVCGQVLSFAGSLVAATAKSVSVVVIGSTMVGFGCGMIFVSYAGISELVPNKWRGAALAVSEVMISLPFGVPSVLIAHALNQNTAAGWRWCYYLAAITSALSLLGTLAFYFPPSRPLQDHERTRWQQTRDIDIVGLALYTGGLTTFLVGLQSAGQEENGWQSTKVIALLVAGLVALVACFLYDFLVASNPVFPYSIFRQLRDVTLLLAVAFLAGLVYYTMSALYPQGSLYMYTTDATQIGLIALPNGVAQFVFGAIAPALISRIKHLKLQLLSALVLQTVFVALGAIAFPNRAAWSAFQVFAIGPFAFITVLCYVITGLNVPLRYPGLASGLVGTFRSMGGAVGNAVFNTILNNSFSAHVGASVAAAAAAYGGFDMSRVGELIGAAIANASGAPYAFESIQGVTVAPDLQAAAALAVREAYVHAYRIVFLATIPFGVVTIIGACFIRDPSEYLTNHTAVQMEKKW